MIEAKKAGELHIKVALSGETVEIMEEFTSIICSVRDFFCDCLPEDVADTIISYCGKLSYAKSQETRNEVMKELADVLKDGLDKLEAEI